MESSPLTLAQTHARKASRADTPTAAIDEHELAAGQFATAASGTENSEAFRTLKLLEEHHRKLSQILKSRVSQASLPKSENASSKSTSGPQPQTSTPQVQPRSPYRSDSQSFAPAHRAPRDVGSSIASDLASARGIPSNRQRRSAQASSPAVAQQQAEGKIVNPQRKSKLAETAAKATNDATRISEKSSSNSKATSHLAQNAPLSEKESQAPSDVAATKNDDAFNRFYNTFENLFSKLSAPLAFAGLPLNPDSENQPVVSPPTPAKPPSSRSTKPSSVRSSNRATVDPEFSHLFSPAALAAVREEPGNAAFGAAESFYVVPTTGGTMQYAHILARHGHSRTSQNHHYHNRTLSRDSTGLSEDIDEFVDARETPGPPSPSMSRKGVPGGQAVGPGGKSMEELQLENESLRTILDEMSRRLWQFEMGAQMGSVALQQSIRASLNRTVPSNTGPGSPAASEAGGGTATGGAGGDNAASDRVAGLEEEVGKTKKELDRMGKENEKLKGAVGRYRERWEKLKEGARTRRGTNGSGGADRGGGAVMGDTSGIDQDGKSGET